MNTDCRTKGFTLVEFVVALAITAVGVVGVLSMFPSGMTKFRDSVALRSAADSADLFLHEIVAEARVDWGVMDAFPERLPTVDEDHIVWSQQSLSPSAHTNLNFSAISATDHFDSARHQDGVFRVSQFTSANSADFECVIRAWKEIEEIENPRLYGDPMPFGVVDRSGGSDPVAYGFTNGQEYVLKYGASGSVSSGNFGALNFSSSASGGGANNYKNAIINGVPSVRPGDQVSVETGNMAGPTVQGIEARAQTPYVRIPVVSSFPSGGGVVTVIQLLPFRLIGCTGSGSQAAEVTAVYVGQDASGSIDLGSSYKVTLKAEASFPAHLPYSSRRKEIYSLKVVKVGNLNAPMGIL